MIYFHIPFCKQKCTYCNFHFSTSLKLREEMHHAMLHELRARKDELQEKKLSSLYFGGGTPSVLPPNYLQQLIDETAAFFDFDSDIEITVEANPDDLDSTYLKSLQNIGVNRLSIGTQSFLDADLQMMNRAHSSAQAEDSIKRAQDTGFHNISIDLIYGSPVSGTEVWKENLQKAVMLDVPHISSYALTVEPKTALENLIKTKKIEAPNDQLQHEQYQIMCNELKSSGFEHYEISNFAKSGFYSRHNTSYWQNKAYLGIGPSAHSFDGHNCRSWNIANNSLYTKALAQGKLPLEKETLSDEERFNEMLMIGLRTVWGVDLNDLENRFPAEFITQLNQDIKEKLNGKLLTVENGYLKIPEENWFLADGIASDLFRLKSGY